MVIKGEELLMTEPTVNEVTLKKKKFANSLVVADLEVTLKDQNMSAEDLFKLAKEYVEK